MARQMNARYAGICVYHDLSGCNRTIAVGDEIMWERGSGAWHFNCGPNARTEPAEVVSDEIDHEPIHPDDDFERMDREVAQGMADYDTWKFLQGAFGENSRELVSWELSNDPESVGGPYY
jgi:hypothetical protein